jgi:hypothetical protein
MYGVLDQEGELLTTAKSLDEAKAAATELVGTDFFVLAPEGEAVAVQEAEPMALAANMGEVVQLRTKKKPAHRALELTGLRPVSFDDVLRMPLHEAWQELRPLFPKKAPVRGVEVEESEGYATPQKMARRMLGVNYKTGKATPREVRKIIYEATDGRASEAKVLGLSLLPHKLVSDDTDAGAEVRRILGEAGRYGIEDVMDPMSREGATVCAFATDACRKSCLVFSGKNLSADYNTMKKYSSLQALVRKPEAFLRMLVEAIERHAKIYDKAVVPLVRLNVYSDIPWELYVPGLFAHFEGRVQFYDYTKVPGRVTPSNYDLTFSFAGSGANAGHIDEEITKHGRRVAVVFAKTGRYKSEKHGYIEEAPLRPRWYKQLYGAARAAAGKTRTEADAWFGDKMFLGLPLLDGDVSDLRPYDEAPSFVGLRWKPPRNQAVDLITARAFVVLGTLVGKSFIIEETPEQLVSRGVFERESYGDDADDEVVEEPTLDAP